MPSCNLSEIVHNRWLQQSGNRGNDLYDATVDDFVRAFMQCTNYYQFLKGGWSGTGPSKHELRLRQAQRSGRLDKVVDAMKTMAEGKEWCTRTPHFEGEEVFGSTARQLNLPLGSEFDSHRPDKMNFSRPKARRATRQSRCDSTPAPIDLSSPSSPTSTDGVRIMSSPPPTSTVLGVQVKHVTSVEESDCDARQWHIARLPKTSKKKCFAKQARTGRTCSEMIIHLGKSTPAPTYTWLLHIRQQLKDKVMEFFHYMDDIERCVKGTSQKWVVGTRPPRAQHLARTTGHKADEGRDS